MSALDDFIAKRENWQRAAEAAKVASRELRAEREAQASASEGLDTDDQGDD